ncbi:hypothetical protein [Synechococcus sp. PCC 6312]|uniref:hypothetical protein n=1 Tax=Synechococcus sp. (strain ATCC 27167 / PCC 6312) TaxID=195253 RepID=UPI00029F403C|nr:hypothetical protein [Synechococcus sp. PCC 6312]AFY60753.1 hypothetical protein Syn6312_1592 [Synechococcus sp. PCC 6312]
MTRVKIYYEPEMELLTVFWQPPSKNQIATELGDGVILIKDQTTGEPIGIELLSYRPSDDRFGAVSVELPTGWEISPNSSNTPSYPSDSQTKDEDTTPRR